MPTTTINAIIEDIANTINALAGEEAFDDAREAVLRELAEARAWLETIGDEHAQIAGEVLLRLGNLLDLGPDDGARPDIDAKIEFPEILNQLGLPDVEFARINEGPTGDGEFQHVMGLDVNNLGSDYELAITGGANGDWFKIGDDGRSLQAMQTFDFDAPQDSGIPNLLPVEIALRDADGNLFDHTRVYVAVRPGTEEQEAAFMASLEEPLRQDVVDMLPYGVGDFLHDHLDVPLAEFLFNPDNDVVLGGPDDDHLPGGEGNDFFFGLPGRDTVVYDGVRSAFDHRWEDGCCVILDKPGGETDHLFGVERIGFDDGNLLFDIDSPNLGLTYRMYVAGLGRTPDEGGLRFWAGAMDYLDAHQPWVDKAAYLADRFVEAPEFKALYGLNPSNTDYVEALYQNVLGRPAEAVGRDYWVGRMDAGVGVDDMLVHFVQSAEAIANISPHYEDGVWVA